MVSIIETVTVRRVGNAVSIVSVREIVKNAVSIVSMSVRGVDEDRMDRCGLGAMTPAEMLLMRARYHHAQWIEATKVPLDARSRLSMRPVGRGSMR